jgi:uridylate kinase
MSRTKTSGSEVGVVVGGGKMELGLSLEKN